MKPKKHQENQSSHLVRFAIAIFDQNVNEDGQIHIFVHMLIQISMKKSHIKIVYPKLTKSLSNDLNFSYICLHIFNLDFLFRLHKCVITVLYIQVTQSLVKVFIAVLKNIRI